MSTWNTSEIAWVRWEGNNSRRHDGTISGVHVDSVVRGADDARAAAEGDEVNVLWGRARGGKLWHGTIVAPPSKPGREKAPDRKRKEPVAPSKPGREQGPGRKRKKPAAPSKPGRGQAPGRKRKKPAAPSKPGRGQSPSCKRKEPEAPATAAKAPKRGGATTTFCNEAGAGVGAGARGTYIYG